MPSTPGPEATSTTSTAVAKRASTAAPDAGDTESRAANTHSSTPAAMVARERDDGRRLVADQAVERVNQHRSTRPAR